MFDCLFTFHYYVLLQFERRIFLANKKFTLSTKNQKLMMRESITSYLFLLPFLLFFIMFVVYPMIVCITTSFTDSTLGSDGSFIGFDNYKNMMKDEIFWKGLKNTLIIVVVSVPIVCAFSLWVASVISKMHVAATSLFRCIFYLPVVTGSVAVTVVWKWMYNYRSGILNMVGKDMGLIDQNINWLGDAKYALWCIILILLTTSVGQPIVLYVSALDNVDKTLVEASEVDGATKMQTFWKVKWPQIMPTTLYILVITTINSFQCFALIQLLTSGGPSNSTMTLMYYIFYNANTLYKFGYANAVGVVLALMIALISAFQFRLGKEK